MAAVACAKLAYVLADIEPRGSDAVIVIGSSNLAGLTKPDRIDARGREHPVASAAQATADV